MSRSPLAVWVLAVLANCVSAQPLMLVNPANGHTYVLGERQLPHCLAQDYAASLGGYLVAVNDAAEDAWIRANFNGQGYTWLGCSDEAVEGVWAWDSGEAFVFSAWCPGEPNNFFQENWAIMNDYCVPGSVLWNDVWPWLNAAVLVEIPVPALPIPAPSGPGQSNSADAALIVNHEGCSGPGPFNLDLWPGSVLQFEWYGAPDSPFLLLTGPLSPAPVFAGCAGWIDIGTAPTWADVVPVFPAILQPFMVLDAGGASQQTFTVPNSIPSGLSFTVQGLILGDPFGPCPVKLTATFTLTVP